MALAAAVKRYEASNRPKFKNSLEMMAYISTMVQLGPHWDHFRLQIINLARNFAEVNFTYFFQPEVPVSRDRPYFEGDFT